MLDLLLPFLCLFPWPSYRSSWPFFFFLSALKFLSSTLQSHSLIFLALLQSLSLFHLLPSYGPYLLLPFLPFYPVFTFYLPDAPSLPHPSPREDDAPFHRGFSVSLSDAFFETSSFVLSAVRIPNNLITLPILHTRAQTIRRNKRNRPSLLTYVLLLLSFTSSIPTIYAIPGTNHLLVEGQKSLDNAKQQHYTKVMMNKIRENQTNDISHQPLNICTNGDVNQHLPTPDHYNNEPYCFVADTDSQQYIIDTGANRVIVNDPSLLANFRASGGGVKGIGGTPVQIRGHGDLTLTIVSDSGKESHKTTFLNAVYVPSSPYNIVPPQLLIANLKDEDDLDVDYAKHDEQNYIISFKKKGLEDEYNTMTIPISNNGLFQFWTKPGYHSFFADASTYQCYECYNSATVIEDYSSDESGNLLQTQDKPREQKPESVEKPREPFNVVPHDHDDDFQSLPSSPREMEPFDTKIDLPLDPNLVILQRKQQVLATIHERLGHLSYSKIKLLARAGLIRSDLANVPPPTCPGCAYGKAHRRPWRHKKKKLPKQSKIKPATKSGQVVSVDQLVSPTPGLIPTHRGNPTAAKYIGATVFIDHYSDLTYVHLMTKLDAESTVNAKLAFERVCDSYGVKVQHYHADNGLFDTKKFKTACEVAQQGLTFCGVNAHHQNGKAENCIKDVTTGEELHSFMLHTDGLKQFMCHYGQQH